MAKLTVRVQPKAKQNQLAGFKEGVLQVRITAPPVEGKANEALVRLLADCLGVSKSRVTIERGFTGRNKTVIIDGLSQSQAEALIEAGNSSRINLKPQKSKPQLKAS
jgi:uncharacterized protein (TIGR00251 family)